MDQWRHELDEHNRDANVHGAAFDRYDAALTRRRESEHDEIWAAVKGIRADVTANTQWRWTLAGGLAVLTLEVTIFGGLLVAHVIH